MRILITGGKGQLGTDLALLLSQRHEVWAPDLDELDVRDGEAVRRAFASFAPRAVMNAAAHTRVDACETEWEEALDLNARAPQTLAREAGALGARFFHVSTDYVFDGKKPPPAAYTEGDAPAPATRYGKSKLLGEEMVLRILPRAVIFRTAWLYGAHGGNFFKAVLEKALRFPGKPLAVVDDQAGSPTWSESLARQMAALLEVEASGVFHAASHGRATWFAAAARFFGRMKIPARLVPVSTEELALPAPRPLNSLLENTRLRQRGLDRMPGWEEDLDRFVDNHGPALLSDARKKGAP